MAKTRIDKSECFTSVGNVLLHDKNLSLEAKGMAAIIMSFGGCGGVSVEELMNLCSDGREAVTHALIELEKTGYLEGGEN